MWSTARDHAIRRRLGTRHRLPGIVYASRFGATFEAWALFDTARIEPVGDVVPLSLDDPDLLAVARVFALRLPATLGSQAPSGSFSPRSGQRLRMHRRRSKLAALPVARSARSANPPFALQEEDIMNDAQTALSKQPLHSRSWAGHLTPRIFVAWNGSVSTQPAKGDLLVYSASPPLYSDRSSRTADAPYGPGIDDGPPAGRGIYRKGG